MALIDKVIPVKGKFLKETRGYREADVQQCLENIRKELKDPRLDRWSSDEIIRYHAGDMLFVDTTGGVA